MLLVQGIVRARTVAEVLHHVFGVVAGHDWLEDQSEEGSTFVVKDVSDQWVQILKLFQIQQLFLRTLTPFTYFLARLELLFII